MARTFQQWECGKELTERLRWHAYASLRQGADCSLLVFRLVNSSATVPDTHHTGARSPLPALAERIRPYVRRTDVVEVDEGSAVVVVAHGANQEGARAAFQRLRNLLATPPLPDDRTIAITCGYATSNAADQDDSTLDARIHEAWKPRAIVRVAVAAQVDPVEAAEAASERLPLRSPRAARRQRAVTALDTSATIAAAESAPRQPRLRLLAAEPRTEPVDEGLRARAHTLGVPFVQLPPRLPASCREAIAPDLARELSAVAIGRSRSMLTVAMHDPRDAAAVLRLRSATGLAIFPVLAAPDALERALQQLPQQIPHM